jgi:heme/copper-type cytochrome/quinol oxidase subunit 1
VVGYGLPVLVLLGGVVGTTLSSLLRSEVDESASRFDAASFSPDPPYHGLITAHAVFQIFFMVMPVLFGSQDTAFPRLNNISFGIVLCHACPFGQPRYCLPAIEQHLVRDGSTSRSG